MNWRNIGKNIRTAGHQFLDRLSDNGILPDFDNTPTPLSKATDRFENASSPDAKLQALQSMDATTRGQVLKKLDAVERDQLLGGTAFDASVHHTGPAYKYDWDNFSPQDTGYNPANAHAMAIASKRVYESPEAIKKDYEAQGFEVKTFDRDGTQAFLAVKDDVAILSFRGTEPDKIQDLATDAQICQVEGPGGKVHEGFNKGLDAVWGDITREMEAQGVGKDKPLYITGHSLGAALGTLAAARLDEQGMTPNGLYTFGSPRVGNEEFADNFNNSELGKRTWRFRNNNDGVAVIPPHGRLMGYSHVGTELYFDNNGSLHNNPDEKTVCRDRNGAFFSPTQKYFLKKHARMKNNDNNPAEHLESMWDHGMTGYVKHIFVNQDFQTSAGTDFKR